MTFGPDDLEYCPVNSEFEGEPQGHCSHWYDCAPCCACGSDEGGEDDCDCPRHA